MFTSIENITLESRLKGIQDAQSRARLALFISAYASGATIFGLWNMYLAWDRQWADLRDKPIPWGQEQLLTQQIRAWVESQSIGVPFFGLRLEVGDITALGTFILFILSFYYCMCARRENHEIGSLLVDTASTSDEVKLHVTSSIKSGMVIHPTSDNDDPYRSINTVRQKSRQSIRFFRPTQVILAFLPVATIAIALLSDLYYAIWYTSPWKRTSGENWLHLDTTYKTQLVVMDLFGLLMGIITFVYCRNSHRYNNSTKEIFTEYANLIKDNGA